MLTLFVAAWAASAAEEFEGRFLRLYWYERDTTFNPHYERRFRVNAPETVLHPEFGSRMEARENGLMLIRAEEDLRHLRGAELYLELWGGHPGTTNKLVIVNGRSRYLLPEVGTAGKHCTYHYPAIPLGLTDLVNGYNAFQFGCDQGTSFWGHFLIDNACLRLALAESHPDLTKAGLTAFTATVKTRMSDAKETMELTLACPPASLSGISSVDYEGYYDGYDENGNSEALDWHGFTKNRKPVGIIGSTATPPFSFSWDMSMIPNQGNMSVRATLHFHGNSNLVYVTAAERNLRGSRRRATVAVYSTKDPPLPFWSRANKKQSCTIHLDVAPEKIERAELYVVTWTGGAGGVKNYFSLNGTPFPVAEGSRHEVQFSRLKVDPAILKQGTNQVELLSDTPHHGIEVFRPGPALVVRSAGEGRRRRAQ
ncbi:MAG: hypothetical protein L0Z50_40515 [Verrucomicrobiales bacterium]|nr:hypothetical protein [Verrucomicrobiales bacterium]